MEPTIVSPMLQEPIMKNSELANAPLTSDAPLASSASLEKSAPLSAMENTEEKAGVVRSFVYDGCTFPSPKVDANGMVLFIELVQKIVVPALAAKNPREFLKAAQIEIIDINGKRFFPQPGD